MGPSSEKLPADSRDGYSAKVELRLLVGGRSFGLGQVCHEWIMFDEPTALPEGDAVVVVTIDGHEQRVAVRIADRQAARRIVPIEIDARR